MTITTPYTNPFDMPFPQADELISRLIALNLKPQSSDRTLLQGLTLICDAFDCPYGLIGRFDGHTSSVETAAFHTASDLWPAHQSVIKLAAISELLSHNDMTTLCHFEFATSSHHNPCDGVALPLIWQGELFGLLILVLGERHLIERPLPLPLPTQPLREAAAFLSLIMVNQILSARKQPAATADGANPAGELREEVRTFSHDLRNPLSAILSCTELLVRQPALLNSDLSSQLLGTIQKSAKQALNLLNALHNRAIY